MHKCSLHEELLMKEQNEHKKQRNDERRRRKEAKKEKNKKTPTGQAIRKCKDETFVGCIDATAKQEIILPLRIQKLAVFALLSNTFYN